MGRGRPKEDMAAKLHRLIRSRIKYKSRGAHVPAKAAQEARRSRPKGADGKTLSAEAFDVWW